MTFRGGASGDSNVSGGGGGSSSSGLGGSLGGGLGGGRGGGLGSMLIGLLLGRVLRGGKGGMTILLLVLAGGAFLLFEGKLPQGLVGGNSAGSSADAQGIQQEIEKCQEDSATANTSDVCRIVWTTRSLDDVWAQQLQAQTGIRYTEAQTVIFSNSVDTGCGAATSDIGPFYCPTDSTAYVDPSFYATLRDQLQGRNEPAAQMYVVAHEYGHHIQNLLKDLGRAQQDPQGADSAAVRTELQADCYAGVWAHYASTTDTTDNGAPLLEPLTAQQLDDIVVTAQAIGDDHIQKVSGRRVDTSTFSHGSSEQRRRWFETGYNGGQVAQCNTFDAAPL